MDQSPDDIKQQIDHTRARLDRHLNRLDDRIGEEKEHLVAASQWWIGVSAVAAGVLGAIWFWPRERRRIGFARAV